ncbi:MAG TPA: glycoside hydrolase family 38 C-terminal domain-containing protein, partial [Chloroflexota bacterium]|nr:glycoside hydrolase family 38 C-terminal domain-containing protein [Chloroflexota bacterium]
LVRLALPLGGQGMAYLDGQPWQGLDGNHQGMILPPAVRDGQPHQVLVEAYAANRTTAPRGPLETCEVGQCGLLRIDPTAQAYAYDLLLGADTLRALPPDSPARAPLLALILAAEQRVDRRRPDSDAFLASLEAARAVLARDLPPLTAAYAERSQVLAMGHAHIDSAWLWPLSQTRRKVARSWSTALRLMERYPDFHFLASQPQQYRWLEEDEPALYRQVEARIAEGRWEPAGAMWVEPDVNLTAGESLVRQLLYGQRYLEERFGRRCGILWLPDAFGYSAALPQLLRSAGVHSFVTSKLSWNSTNRMPHDTFRWRGLDGTEVLAYFITAGIDPRAEPGPADPDSALRDIATYNGHMTPLEVASAWQRYADKPLNDTVLYPFGWGDGGGGPTEEMLEVAERLAAYPGLPRLTQGSAEAFLRALHDRLLHHPGTPVWDGELYFEYHRGTYTSQGGVKRGNRRGEHALHDAELWAAWAASRGAEIGHWRARLAEAWELLLLNQFHDILPGSSIGEVYRDQERDHARVQSLTQAVRQEAQAALAAEVTGPGEGLALFSSLPWERTDISVEAAALGDLVPLGPDAQPLPLQPVTDLDGAERALIGGLEVPGMGYRTVRLGRAGTTAQHAAPVVTERKLENRYFLLELDEAGRISRLYDRRYNREVLAPQGGGNRLLAYEDKPLDFDAWDIDSFYTEKCWEIDAVSDWRVVERGPLRAGVEICRQWDGSTITQRLLLYADLPRIDIQTHIDWHHHQVLLKAAFPLALRATQARYECAFGWVERPTHRNTSWDTARFEVTGHRWADLSVADFGVSLLNDSKYGYDCLDATLRLTLLKSAIDPDAEADQGAHHFSYALLPHGPEWTVVETVRAAYAFNLPLTSRRHDGGAGTLPPAQSLVSTTSRHAVIDTVKPAEDGDGLIVRVYDCAGGRERTELSFAAPIATAHAVTILEEPDTQEPAPQVAGSTLAFPLPPFAVRSFRVRLA